MIVKSLKCFGGGEWAGREMADPAAENERSGLPFLRTTLIKREESLSEAAATVVPFPLSAPRTDSYEREVIGAGLLRAVGRCIANHAFVTAIMAGTIGLLVIVLGALAHATGGGNIVTSLF